MIPDISDQGCIVHCLRFIRRHDHSHEVECPTSFHVRQSEGYYYVTVLGGWISPYSAICAVITSTTDGIPPRCRWWYVSARSILNIKVFSWLTTVTGMFLTPIISLVIWRMKIRRPSRRGLFFAILRVGTMGFYYTTNSWFFLIGLCHINRMKPRETVDKHTAYSLQKLMLIEVINRSNIIWPVFNSMRSGWSSISSLSSYQITTAVSHTAE